MLQARPGDTVKVRYTGKLDDGAVFDTTGDRDPIEFRIGGNQVIPGFEQAVLGMSPGDKKTTKISSKRAYGPYRKDLVVDVQKDKILDKVDPEVGSKLQVEQPDGQKFIVTVTHVENEKITLDANHPLAGKDLTFDIHLLEIVGK
jgi:peptidylprolyl isomerase